MKTRPDTQRVEPHRGDGSALLDSSEVTLLDPQACRFLCTLPGRLSLTIAGDRSYPRVKLRRLFPVRHPRLFIAVSDAGGSEIGIIRNLEELDSASCRLAEKELDIFYAIPEIREIRSIEAEYGFFCWKTVTNRGPRTFWVKGRTENITSPAPGRLFVTDIEECRYDIPDIDALPRLSRRILDQVI
jgi:hypothetical protein